MDPGVARAFGFAGRTPTALQQAALDPTGPVCWPWFGQDLLILRTPAGLGNAVFEKRGLAWWLLIDRAL